MNSKQQTCILVVEDDVSLREAIVDTLDLAGYCVIPADNGRMALQIIEDKPVAMVISDVQMPKMDGHQLLKYIKRNYRDIPVVLMTAFGTIDKAISAMKDGASDYLVKPFEPEVLVATISQYLGQEDNDYSMIANDPVMQPVVQMARRVAATDATVMISGNSGSGKEVIARFIHANSPRVNKPFVAINCAAIPENMLEATLFGYEKGAFTGAYKASAGKFEQAQGGTLLLDEISEMELGLQAKILRVIQEKEVERLGGNQLIKLDVRILATSNRDMRAYVREGKFREDLFYRLNVFPIHLPDLRQRQQDILPLAEFLLQKTARSSARKIPQISEIAKQKLITYHWPGNIRELDNVIQRAFILHMQGSIEAEDIIFEAQPVGEGWQDNQDSVVKPNQAATQSVADYSNQTERVYNNGNNCVVHENTENLHSDMKKHEYDVILDILKSTFGNRKLAAERLGISQRTLRYKLAKMRDSGLNVPSGYAKKVLA